MPLKFVHLRTLLPVCLMLLIPPFAYSNAYSNAHSQFRIPRDWGDSIRFADARICQPDRIEWPRDLALTPTASHHPIQLEADAISATKTTVELHGAAQVRQGSRGLFADHITFSRATQHARAEGYATLYPNLTAEIRAEIRANTLDLAVDTLTGYGEEAAIRLVDTTPLYYTARRHQGFVEDYSLFAPLRAQPPNSPAATILTLPLTAAARMTPASPRLRARGRAARIEFNGDAHQKLFDATFTTCKTGDDTVALVAEELILDHTRGEGRAKAMTLKFKNVPILYLPRLTFPLDTRRKSGFLYPTIGYDKPSGATIKIPYYVNLAPAYDATFSTTILSQRGLQLASEFRYLSPHSTGTVEGEWLDSDRVFGVQRYAYRYAHDYQRGEHWTGQIRFQEFSDDAYLDDFSSDIEVTAATFIENNAHVNYVSDPVDWQLLASDYEPIDATLQSHAQPYQRLPQLTVNIHPQNFGIFRYGFASEYTAFRPRDEALVRGTRLRFKPYLSLPIERNYGYLRAKIALQSLSYSLDLDAGDTSPALIIPSTTIDSGLLFTRKIGTHTATNDNSVPTYLQTLEPRLLYVNILKKPQQENFPDFDTHDNEVGSFSQIFRENRFFGGDRVGDTQHLVFGLTSRFINQHNGQQRAKFSLGQIFYFTERTVGLTPTSPDEQANRSDLLTEISARITPDWALRNFMRWSTTDDYLVLQDFTANYFHSNRRHLQLSYISERTTAEAATEAHGKVQMNMPLSAKWQLDTRFNYALVDEKMHYSGIGIGYDGCCFATRLAMQRYLNDDDELTNRFTFTFELSGLGKIHSRANY